MVSSIVMSFGVLAVLHATQAAVLYQSMAGLQGFKTALLMLLGNFLIPFSETAAMAMVPSKTSAESLSESMSIGVWSFWMPALLGMVLFLYGATGHLSLRFPHVMFTLPFAMVAVVFLVWQVEVSQMSAKVANEEEFVFHPDHPGMLDPSQAMHYDIFRTSYTKLVQWLKEQHCTVTPAPGPGAFRPMHVNCQEDSVEARMLQVVLSEFCKPRSNESGVVEDFLRRVEVCKAQGSKLKIMKEAGHVEDAYCRCRAMFYDILQVMSQWMMIVWFCQFFAVCAVLYFSVEANLLRMDKKERREILCFSAAGVVALICRVTLFDGTLVQMSQSLAEAAMGGA